MHTTAAFGVPPGLLCRQFFSLDLSGSAQAGWVWANPFGATSSGNLTSFSGQLTPVQGAGSDPTNSLDRRGWDRAPLPFQFNVSSGNSEPFALIPTTSSGGVTTPVAGDLTHFTVDLDPDDNGVLPSNITVETFSPVGVTWRGLFNGSHFWTTVSNQGMQFDVSMEYFDGNLDQIPVDSSGDYTWFSAGGAVQPTTSLGVATWDDYSNSRWVGLGNGGYNVTNTGTPPTPATNSPGDVPHPTFPWPTALGNPDPTFVPNLDEVIRRQVMTFSDFSNFGDGSTGTFRLSFDGGVPENTPLFPIPEPTSSALVIFSLGLLGFRRRRGS